MGMNSSKIRFLVLALVSTLAAACATTTDEDNAQQPQPAGSNAAATSDSDDESGDGEEEQLGETSSAVGVCGVTCGYRMRSGPHYYYYCSGPCNGNGFWKPFLTWKGHSFCYSRHAC